MADFWSGREPCWDFLGCPENIYSRCPAYHNRDKPCWEQATTQCRKVLGFEWECGDCKVFNFYGRGGQKFVSSPNLENHSLSLEGETDLLA